MTSHHQDDTERRVPINEEPQDEGVAEQQRDVAAGRRGTDGDDAAGGQVSQAGGSTLNEETAEGGADAVPDTPDVNR